MIMRDSLSTVLDDMCNDKIPKSRGPWHECAVCAVWESRHECTRSSATTSMSGQGACVPSARRPQVWRERANRSDGSTSSAVRSISTSETCRGCPLTIRHQAKREFAPRGPRGARACQIKPWRQTQNRLLLDGGDSTIPTRNRHT